MAGSDQPDWSEIRRLYVRGGMTIAAIAGLHGISAQRLARRARSDGWPPRQSRAAHSRDGPKRTPIRKPPGEPAKAQKPRPQPPTVHTARSLKARRTLVRRLYRAIDTKLQQMERRMAHDMATDEHPSETSAADHERDTRAIGALIANLSRVTEIEADLERIPGAAAPTTDRANEQADRQLADEAERFRRDVAERLARLGRQT